MKFNARVECNALIDYHPKSPMFCGKLSWHSIKSCVTWEQREWIYQQQQPSSWRQGVTSSKIEPLSTASNTYASMTMMSDITTMIDSNAAALFLKCLITSSLTIFLFWSLIRTVIYDSSSFCTAIIAAICFGPMLTRLNNSICCSQAVHVINIQSSSAQEVIG